MARPPKPTNARLIPLRFPSWTERVAAGAAAPLVMPDDLALAALAEAEAEVEEALLEEEEVLVLDSS